MLTKKFIHNICSDQLTPPATRVEVVDQINRIACKGSTKLQLSKQAITKLRGTWEQKEAKQRQQEQQENTPSTTQGNSTKAKMIRKLQRRLTRRSIKREHNRNMEGTAVMDSGTTSTVIQPRDNKYVIDTDTSSNKIFTVATGEQARAGNQAKLKINLRSQTTQSNMVPTL